MIHEIKTGDWLITLFGVALVFFLMWSRWQTGVADRVLIRSQGESFAELNLKTPQRVSVPGPLGNTEIEILEGVVRVAKDPGPRQLCVNQGWLSRPGQIAICLPNRVSIEVLGKVKSYDSLGY